MAPTVSSPTVRWVPLHPRAVGAAIPAQPRDSPTCLREALLMLSIMNSSNPLFMRGLNELKAASLLMCPPAQSIPLEAWLFGSAYHDLLCHCSSRFWNWIEYWEFLWCLWRKTQLGSPTVQHLVPCKYTGWLRCALPNCNSLQRNY